MTDATETELIGVTLLKKVVQQIDTELVYSKDLMMNRQDWIREAIKEKLDRVEANKQ